MKHVSMRSVLLSLIALLSIAGCVSPLEGGGKEQGRMICVRFFVQKSSVLPQTKALPESLIAGVKNEDVSFMYLYCFDVNGRYIGRYPATIETSGIEEEFSATIPSGTKRVHFIANVDKPIGNDKIGYTEDQLFHGDEEGLWGLTDCNRNKIAYWGYIRKDEGEVFADNTIVYLIPDRSLLISGQCSDNNITSLQWTVYNGKSFGFIAPYPFNTLYWKENDVLIPNAPLTPHLNTARDMSDDDNELDTWASDPANWKAFPKVPSESSPATNFFIFEDKNELNPNNTPPTKEMPRVIIKATFTDKSTKYFPIRLTKEDGETSLELHRGHSYVLNLDYLPEVMGKGTFHEAAKASSFANGQLVDIPSNVTEVSDGKFSLKVVYELGEDKNISTSAVFQVRPSDGKVQIPFEFLTFPAGNNPTSDDLVNWTFSAEWLTNPQNTVATSDNLKVVTTKIVGENEVSLLSTEGRGYVELVLNNISEDLKQGIVSLKAKYEKTEGEGDDAKTTKYTLERYIYIYSITEFKLNGNASLTQKSETVNGESETYYRLSFTLPSTNAYPSGLYPMKVMIASKTLRPYRAYNVAGTAVPEEGVVFGVDNRSTKPTDVPGIEYPTGEDAIHQWNYQEPNNPWNFWYIYTIYSKKEGDTYYIDFKDITESYGSQTISNLGLYLKIEFFGNAKPVYITPS